MLNGGQDVGICAAAADVAAHGFADIGVGPSAGFFQQSDGRHNLAGGAIAALETVVFDEGGLHGMKPAGFAKAFDGGDLVAVVHGCESEAGVDAAAVDVNGASATLAMIAALLGSGQMEFFAQAVEQRRAWVEVYFVGLAVDS